jgi:hypothetical protein
MGMVKAMVYGATFVAAAAVVVLAPLSVLFMLGVGALYWAAQAFGLVAGAVWSVMCAVGAGAVWCFTGWRLIALGALVGVAVLGFAAMVVFASADPADGASRTE